MQREMWLSDLPQDVRIAFRGLLRAPALAATILLTVGLGIGATTVIFAAVDAALLRPLPYRDPDRLAWIYLDSPPFMFRFSLVDYQALVAQQTQFDRVAAFTDRSMAFTTSGAAAEAAASDAPCRGRTFSVLGITPALGRDFAESDGRPGPPAVIVSHGFWQQRLGGRTDVVGQTREARWRRSHARRRPATARESARTASGILRRLAVRHAAAPRSVPVLGGRTAAARRHA